MLGMTQARGLQEGSNMLSVDQEFPWWNLTFIIGAEEETEEEAEEETEETEEEAEEEAEEEGEDEVPEGFIRASDAEAANVALRKALREERKGRKVAEKAAKAAAKAAPKPKPKSETDEADGKVAEANEKAEKLAAGILRKEVDNVVGREARKLKFVDEEDAIRLVKRSEIDADQDEDDPTEVEVDAESVVDALKALAKKKPHLIQKATDEEEEDEREPVVTSKRNGRKGKKGSLDDETLKNTYGALRD